MAIFQSRRRTSSPRSDHAPGRQERSPANTLRHAADPSAGRRGTFPGFSMSCSSSNCCGAWASSSNNSRRMPMPSCARRHRLPNTSSRTTTASAAPACGFGHADRPDAGALRRGYIPKPGGDKIGRRRLGTISSDSRNSARNSTSTLPTSSSWSRAGSCGNLHAAGRSLGDGYGQHHHGRRDGPGIHDDLQRRVRTLHPAAVQDAQPHGRPHLGHRLEPAHDRGRLANWAARNIRCCPT